MTLTSRKKNNKQLHGKFSWSSSGIYKWCSPDIMAVVTGNPRNKWTNGKTKAHVVCSLQKTKPHRIGGNSPQAVFLKSARPRTFHGDKARRQLLTMGHGSGKEAGPCVFVYLFIQSAIHSFRKAPPPFPLWYERYILQRGFPKTFLSLNILEWASLGSTWKGHLMRTSREKKSEVWMGSLFCVTGRETKERQGEEREREGGCHGGPRQRLLINIQNQLQNCLSSPPQLEDICILASGNLSIKKKVPIFHWLVGAVYNIPVTSIE